MNKVVVGLATGWLALASAFSHATELAPNAPEVYVVVKGDTLWGIASRFLQDPWKWPEVWQANPQVDNPHLIFPGDVLSLVYVDGQPRIVLNRGDQGVKMPDGTVKLTPQARVLSEGDAIQTIPLEIIGPFLRDARVVEEDAMAKAAYIVASDGDRVVPATGDRVYVRGTSTGPEKMYSFFRPGPAYIDPVTEEVLGHESLMLGTGELLRNGDPATFLLRKTVQETRVGDRAMPVDERALDPVFIPRKAPDNINAHILANIGGVGQIGQYAVVVISKGEREGLKVGHTLTAHAAGKIVKDRVAAEREANGDGRSIFRRIADFFTGNDSRLEEVQLPDEEAGTLLVFRTFDKVSMAVVMEATRPLHVGDLATTPQ